ncbi:nuclease-related domain-containing protein [Alkalibacillus almallahensis]|uniref:nuclease-related domain-containing protein n=1 Tax=Alkalibacillus almallahensis TaxID=1379154 RepID=UPI00141F6752|nr:nuclease-related domain-containing protein [Alkalibacillus almallahensis]NIK13301.1 hypothetical protein [Alkalibacillus almallahensis]
MIILPHQKPQEVSQLECIVPRYTKQDQTSYALQNQLGKVRAGYFGERSLHYYLNLLKLDDCFLLFGFRSRGIDSYFQIDTLLITRSFVLIIEAKHLKGSLSFNEAKQLLQEVDGRTEVYPNPLIQANIQRHQLYHFLNQRQLDQLPIFTCVTFTHSKSILNFAHESNDILTSQRLPGYIHQLLSEHSSPVISHHESRKMAQTLKECHTPKPSDVIEDYQISDNDVKKGVWCTACGNFMMDRIFGNWRCPSCYSKDQLAHIPGLRDYAIIYNQLEINNNQARAFLNVESASTMKRLLRGLEANGEKKGRTYQLNSLF